MKTIRLTIDIRVNNDATPGETWEAVTRHLPADCFDVIAGSAKEIRPSNPLPRECTVSLGRRLA